MQNNDHIYNRPFIHSYIAKILAFCRKRLIDTDCANAIAARHGERSEGA